MDNTFEGENTNALATDLADRQQHAKELLATGFTPEEVAVLYGPDALPPTAQEPR